MNIRDSHLNPNRSDSLRNGSVGPAARPDAAYTAQSTNAASKTVNTDDSIEISDAGRAAAENRQAYEIDFAKKALLGIPPLSQERAADILQRIQAGYYSQPEVLTSIAGKVIANLRAAGDI